MNKRKVLKNRIWVSLFNLKDLNKYVILGFVFFFFTALAACRVKEIEPQISANTIISQNNVPEAVPDIFSKAWFIEGKRIEVKTTYEYDSSTYGHLTVFGGNEKKGDKYDTNYRAIAFIVDDKGKLVTDLGHCFGRCASITQIYQQKNGDLIFYEASDASYMRDAEWVFEESDEEILLLKKYMPQYSFTYASEEKCPKGYRILLDKVWVGELDSKKKYYFYFTEVTENQVKGRIDTSFLTPPGPTSNTFVLSESSSGIFTGEIEGEIANCSFELQNGESGAFQIEMSGSEQGETIKLKNLDETSVSFKPLHLSELESFEQNNKIELCFGEGVWRGCHIVVGETTNTGRGTMWADIYFADASDNILYSLDYNGAGAGEIVKSIKLVDLNEDCLEDIRVEYEDGKTIQFRQRDDGLFYASSWLEGSEWHSFY